MIPEWLAIIIDRQDKLSPLTRRLIIAACFLTPLAAIWRTKLGQDTEDWLIRAYLTSPGLFSAYVLIVILYVVVGVIGFLLWHSKRTEPRIKESSLDTLETFWRMPYEEYLWDVAMLGQKGKQVRVKRIEILGEERPFCGKCPNIRRTLHIEYFRGAMGKEVGYPRLYCPSCKQTGVIGRSWENVLEEVRSIAFSKFAEKYPTVIDERVKLTHNPLLRKG